MDEMLIAPGGRVNKKLRPPRRRGPADRPPGQTVDNDRSLVERFDAAAVDVVAGAAVGRVRAGAAGEGVVAVAAEQQVVAGVAVDRVAALAADEDVVVRPAVDRQLDTV